MKQRKPKSRGESPKPRSRARPKRALTNVGGKVERRGDPVAAELLDRALKVAPGSGLDRWTHGFHTYPARMHPDTAGRLVRQLSQPGQSVLDPFCGSGTVVLEALIAGRLARGRDLSPLAVRLARLRCAVTSETQRRALRNEARRISDLAETRSAQRPNRLAGPSSKEQVLFTPEVFLELSWLRLLLTEEQDLFAREALEMVLSSILVKASHRVSDTDRRVFSRPGPKFRATRRFRDRAGELSERLAHLARDFWAKREQVAKRHNRETDSAQPLRPLLPRAELELDDARTLSSVADGSVDVVITSPPYPNVYDYADHHAIRTQWLGLDDHKVRAGEIGARRSFSQVAQGLEQWESDGRAWVATLARVLRPGGRAAILGGDGASPAGAILFDECLFRWAAQSGLTFLAAASQTRPAFDPETRHAFRGDDRREHLILLERPGPTPDR